jgi:histidine triad (HIT) family protein
MTCPFCAIVSGEAPAHRVAETAANVAFLDARPVFEGHVLIVPRGHVTDFTSLAAAAIDPLFSLGQRVARALEVGIGAEGAFIGLNHRISQSVPHVHLHVVPRHKGDGLRGFFWPRRKYESEEAAAAIAARIRAALEAAGGVGGSGSTGGE